MVLEGPSDSPEDIEARDVAEASERLSLAFGIFPSRLLSAVNGDAIEEEEEQEEQEEVEETKMGEEEYDEQIQLHDHDLDEGDEEATDDDPVDLAMRIVDANRMEMETDGEDDEEDDEKIVYAGLSSSQLNTTPSVLPLFCSFFQGYLTHCYFFFSNSPPANSNRSPPSSASRTAAGLLQQLMGGGGVSTKPSASNQGGLVQPVPASSTSSRSIWAPTGGFPGAFPSPSPVAAAETFESLPNTTHQALGGPSLMTSTSFSRHQSFSGSGGELPVPSSLGGGPSSTPSLFGSFAPFATSPRPSSLQIQQQQSPSDLSPLANPFTGSPRRYPAAPPIVPVGWPPLSPYPPA